MPAPVLSDNINAVVRIVPLLVISESNTAPLTWHCPYSIGIPALGSVLN